MPQHGDAEVTKARSDLDPMEMAPHYYGVGTRV